MHSRKPLISVVIPTHNYGLLIPDTLASLQAQTFLDWEATVVDDGSTDSTASVVADFAHRDTRIHYLGLPRHGVSRARNEGIRKSQGDFLQFLDADDMLESGKLAFQSEYLQRRADVGIVYGSVRYFRSGHPDDRWFTMFGQGEPWMPGVCGSGADVLTPLLESNIMAINSPLLGRRVLEDVGLFDEDLGAVEDWDLWIRCAVRGVRFEYAPADGTLALVRSHPSSLSRDPRKMADGRALIQRKIDNIINDGQSLAAARRRLDERWAERVERVCQAVGNFIPADDRFIFIAPDSLRAQPAYANRAMPFMEHNGDFWGLPPDDEAALAELDRQRAEGIGFVVLTWPAFWCLDYYPRLSERLRTHYACVHRDDAAIVYDVRTPMPPNRERA